MANTFVTQKPANASNGVVMQVGPVDTENKFPGNPRPSQTKEFVLEFSYDSLPTFTTDELVMAIPPHAFILSAHLGVVTAFTGGTSYDIGLYTKAGVAIDADGLYAGLVLASLTPRGKWNIGAGALVGAGIGATAGQIVVAATGTFTAGKAKLVVRYMPLDDATIY